MRPRPRLRLLFLCTTAQVVGARGERGEIGKPEADSGTGEDAQAGCGVCGADQHGGHGERIGDFRDVEKPADADDFVRHAAGGELLRDLGGVPVLAHQHRGGKGRALLLGLPVLCGEVVGHERELILVRREKPEGHFPAVRTRPGRKRGDRALFAGAQHRVGHAVGQSQDLRRVAPRGGQLLLRRGRTVDGKILDKGSEVLRGGTAPPVDRLHGIPYRCNGQLGVRAPAEQAAQQDALGV